VNNLWALALAYGAELSFYDRRVGQTATLFGRTLEPWRAILAVAHWLTDCGMTDLASRIEGLAKKYQTERPDLEPANLTALVVRALISCTLPSIISVSSNTSMSPEGRQEWTLKTAEVTNKACEIAQATDLDIDQQCITSKRVGRILGRLRISKHSNTSIRAWEVKASDVWRLALAFGFTSHTPPANACNAANACHACANERNTGALDCPP
jgi:hypothetical protein